MSFQESAYQHAFFVVLGLACYCFVCVCDHHACSIGTPQMTGKAIQDWLQLTDSAAQEENEPVALQAIEFWSAICEAETKRSDEIEEVRNWFLLLSGRWSHVALCLFQAKARGISTNVQFHNFATQALPQLMPLILTCLTKQVGDTAAAGPLGKFHSHIPHFVLLCFRLRRSTMRRGMFPWPRVSHSATSRCPQRTLL